MSILSTLLTGGTIVGKVCQSLASAFSATDKETGIQVSLSSMNINGVRFIRSNAENINEMKTYAYNSNIRGRQCIAFPNLNESVGGASLLINPTKKLPIDNFLCDNVSPDTNIVVGPAENAVENDSNGLEEQLRFTFNNVTIGGGRIFAGSFSLSCTTTQLIIVIVGGAASYLIYKLSECKIKKGHHDVHDYREQEAFLQSSSQGKNGEEKTFVFDVPLDKYGYKEGDVLDEVILSLNVERSTSFTSSMLKDNQSLHPVEIRLLQELETQINQQL